MLVVIDMYLKVIDMYLNSNTIFQIDLFLNGKIQSIFSLNGLNDVVDSLNIILINKHLDTSIKELLLDKEFTKMLIWVSLPIFDKLLNYRRYHKMPQKARER